MYDGRCYQFGKEQGLEDTYSISLFPDKGKFTINANVSIMAIYADDISLSDNSYDNRLNIATAMIKAYLSLVGHVNNYVEKHNKGNRITYRPSIYTALYAAQNPTADMLSRPDLEGMAKDFARTIIDNGYTSGNIKVEALLPDVYELIDDLYMEDIQEAIDFLL